LIASEEKPTVVAVEEIVAEEVKPMVVDEEVKPMVVDEEVKPSVVDNGSDEKVCLIELLIGRVRAKSLRKRKRRSRS
jgi:hypothetical protein